MKIVVYPHELAIGGSQINAIDLAAAVEALGHEVLVYAPPGPLENYIGRKRLRYVRAHPLPYRPAPTRIVQLLRLARRERVDVFHAYEWPPCLDAFFGAGLFLNVPVVCTVLSMSVMPTVPRHLPLLMGTRALAETAGAKHRATVRVMEPPIDVDADHPANDDGGFRTRHGLAPEELLVVTVSRLALELKFDALRDAIDAIDLLAADWPARLAIVGDGDAAPLVRAHAAAVNRRHGREVVILAGAALDPRPAYAAADIVIGMGSSALRGLAHGKPLVVQGERGFSAPFDPAHESIFLWQGFHGVGDGTRGGPCLAGHLRALMANPAQRATLGTWGRNRVVERFALPKAATRLVEIYTEAMSEPRGGLTRWSNALRSAWLAGGIELRNHLPSLFTKTSG